MGSNSLVVTSYFGLPEPLKAPTDVFVLMSFEPELRPIYDEATRGKLGQNWLAFILRGQREEEAPRVEIPGLPLRL
jgi:hypothetical protein